MSADYFLILFSATIVLIVITLFVNNRYSIASPSVIITKHSHSTLHIINDMFSHTFNIEELINKQVINYRL